MWMAAILITLALSIPARAAISNGPLLTNAVASEQQRILQFYQAEQSFQEKLRVGRERYNQKQMVRANILAGMKSELQARQQTVVLQPAAAPDADTDQSAGWFRPSLVVALLSACLVAYGFYLFRHRAQVAFGQKRQFVAGPAP
jgi:hypothetical protein